MPLISNFIAMGIIISIPTNFLTIPSDKERTECPVPSVLKSTPPCRWKSPILYNCNTPSDDSNTYISSRYQYLTKRTVFVYLVFDLVLCVIRVTIGKSNKLYPTRTSLSKSFVINSLRFARNDARRSRNGICQNPRFFTFELSDEWE